MWPSREETGKHESNLLKMLEDKDKVIKATLESRDREWLSGPEHCTQSLRLITYEQINNRTCDAPKPGGPLTTRQPAEYS